MTSRKDLLARIDALIIDHTSDLARDRTKLFNDCQEIKEERDSWEQKYHSAMAANKRLDEKIESLSDEFSEWKHENSALNALNATLSEKLQKLEERCANQYQDLLKQEKSSQNWQGNYYAMQRLKDSLAKELDALMVKLEEAYKVGNQWFEKLQNLTLHYEKLKTAFDAAEERHEEFEKKSHGILATMEENLRIKQETIEALTTWKEGSVEYQDTLEEKLKDAKDVIQTQENTIEWLDGKVRRLKEKKAKKEQND